MMQPDELDVLLGLMKKHGVAYCRLNGNEFSFVAAEQRVLGTTDQEVDPDEIAASEKRIIERDLYYSAGN